MYPLKTKAIKAFLEAKTHNDLASLYTHDMECQVVVAQDEGERLDGEFEGVRWNGYSNGIESWRPFRIPRNAATEPEYEDHALNFDLAKRAEAIGMTGWDWKNKVSKWVAFDFDAIIGHSDKHSAKLTPEQMAQVREAATSVPWVTVRYSTSGKGLHIYVFVDDVPTNNHTEHAALARSILFKMTSLTGFDFKSKVDICGGNMWVWHRKMLGTEGLQIIKEGVKLHDIPPNWRDNVPVISGKTRKLDTPTDLKSLNDSESSFEMLCGQRIKVKLDKEHIKLIDFLNVHQLYHWWDGDRHILVTHTSSLKRAHTELGLKGIFETDTRGSTTHNCFLFPLRNGAWAVRRFSPGVREHVSWSQDGKGWTNCYLNQDPTIYTAARAYNGMEDPSGGFHFVTGEDASKVANLLGGNFNIPPRYAQRRTFVKMHKDGGRLIVEMPHEAMDNASELPDWLHKNSKWIKLVPINKMITNDFEGEDYDNLVRHLVSSGEDGGWALYSQDRWTDEPLTHARAALMSMQLKRQDVDSIIGNAVLRPWTLVKQPFQSEYPGDRSWNRKAPQFKFLPKMDDNLNYPTWLSVLKHIGKALDPFLIRDNWFKNHGIETGADYLKIWIASMIQYPSEPLPYLFIYGETQETGKSTLHEGLQLLFNPGYVRVDHALQNSSSFNAELEGAILCIVEETDLSKNTTAYNRIKDWVTSPQLSIHRKGLTPYMVENTTHFIQTANPRNAVPIFPGDTRITMINVAHKPENPINKRELMKMLSLEAPDFLGALLRLEIPDSNSRLRVPVIVTDDKITAEHASRNLLQEFIDECCYYSPGSVILLGEFFEHFINWMDPTQRVNWTKQKVSAAMPERFVKGKAFGSSWHWGNISMVQPTEEDLKKSPLISINGTLKHDC
jgi:hypothetical protein